MDKCPRCGVNLKQNQKFCTKCGTKIEEKKGKNLSPEILAKIDILQKKISHDNLNSSYYINLGDIYFQNKMYTDAILEYQKVLNIEENNFNALLNAAETYLKLKDYNNSELLFNKAKEISSDSQELKIGLFWLYYHQKKYDSLIEINKGIENDLKDVNYHYVLKEVCNELEYEDAAFNEMEIIFKYQPEDINNLREIANYYEKDKEKSVEFYKKILDLNNEDIDSNFIVAQDFLFKHKYENAIKMLKSKVSLYPKELQKLIYMYLSNAYLNLNDIDKATYYSQYMVPPGSEELEPRDKKLIAETLFELSNILFNKKKLTSAINFLEKATKFSPNNKIYINKFEKIKALKKQKNIKKGLLYILIVAVLCLTLISVIYMINLSEKNIWKSVKDQNTFSSYQTYINKYPKGKYLNEAKNLKDDSFWKETKKQNSFEAYKKYLSLNPDGKYLNEAKNLKDDSFWKETKKQNSFEAYKKYLSLNPDGKYINDAFNQIISIYLTKSYDRNDIPMIYNAEEKPNETLEYNKSGNPVCKAIEQSLGRLEIPEYLIRISVNDNTTYFFICINTNQLSLTISNIYIADSVEDAGGQLLSSEESNDGNYSKMKIFDSQYNHYYIIEQIGIN